MARTQHVEVRLRIAAPREKVWSLYIDHAGWTRWAGLGRITLEREGDPAPNGRGCIRVFHTTKPPGREEVLSVEAPARMTYRVLSGMPIRDHQGEATFEEDGAGTRVVWRCRFVSKVPLMGGVMRIGVSYVFARTLRRLAKQLS